MIYFYQTLSVSKTITSHTRVTLSRMNAIEATLLTIQSEMDNLAKVIARLAATLEGFERQQITSQWGSDR